MNIIVNTPAQLGEILSSARQAKGLTQAEAAMRIGVGQSRLSLLESTRTESLSLSQLLELTALYGLGQHPHEGRARLRRRRVVSDGTQIAYSRIVDLGKWPEGWHLADSARGDMELLYDAGWKQSSVGRPLSLSLPFGVGDAPLRGERINHYFDNLLPDSDVIRRRLAARFGIATTEPFDLLAALGRDCVGAVQLLGEDDVPTGLDRIDGTPLSDDDVARVLDHTSGVAVAAGDDDDFRLSLAGAQEKTALLFHDGRWMRPHGATPTTHILKLPLGLVGNKRADLTASVENEWLCLAILRAFGLPAANAEIVQFGAYKVLSVERFDRALHRDGGWLLRLPQEDFCQALGVPPHLKYESHGGPGVPDLAVSCAVRKRRGKTSTHCSRR